MCGCYLTNNELITFRFVKKIHKLTWYSYDQELVWCECCIPQIYLSWFVRIAQGIDTGSLWLPADPRENDSPEFRIWVSFLGLFFSDCKAWFPVTCTFEQGIFQQIVRIRCCFCSCTFSVNRGCRSQKQLAMHVRVWCHCMAGSSNNNLAPIAKVKCDPQMRPHAMSCDLMHSQVHGATGATEDQMGSPKGDLCDPFQMSSQTWSSKRTQKEPHMPVLWTQCLESQMWSPSVIFRCEPQKEHRDLVNSSFEMGCWANRDIERSSAWIERWHQWFIFPRELCHRKRLWGRSLELLTILLGTMTNSQRPCISLWYPLMWTLLCLNLTFGIGRRKETCMQRRESHFFSWSGKQLSSRVPGCAGKTDLAATAWKDTGNVSCFRRNRKLLRNCRDQLEVWQNVSFSLAGCGGVFTWDSLQLLNGHNVSRSELQDTKTETEGIVWLTACVRFTYAGWLGELKWLTSPTSPISEPGVKWRHFAAGQPHACA